MSRRDVILTNVTVVQLLRQPCSGEEGTAGTPGRATKGGREARRPARGAEASGATPRGVPLLRCFLTPGRTVSPAWATSLATLRGRGLLPRGWLGARGKGQEREPGAGRRRAAVVREKNLADWFPTSKLTLGGTSEKEALSVSGLGPSALYYTEQGHLQATGPACSRYRPVFTTRGGWCFSCPGFRAASRG